MTEVAKPMICEKLLDLPEGFEIWRVNPLLLKEQDKNARVQSHDTFKSLVRNIQQRGAMESLPFCSRQDLTFSLISGHHRVRAAIQAELASIVVLADPRPLTRSELVAKQLAHNAINGKDDPSVLLQLLGEIQDVEALMEASIDRADIEKLVRQDVQVPDVKELVDQIGHEDVIGVVDRAAYDAFVSTMRRLGKTADIRSVGAMIARMTELTKAHLDAVDAAAVAHGLAGPATPGVEGTAE